MKVLVTDAHYKHALGAIRCLGKHKIEVISASHYKNAQGFYSKFSSKEVIYPNPHHEQEFTDFMMDFLKNNPVDVVLPIGYVTSVALSKNLENFQALTKIPLASWAEMEKASSKDKTMDFAESIGVRIPKKYALPSEIDHFPVVLKGTKESGHINYVNSQEELEKLDQTDSIIQEYIQGEGYGFFALMDHGQEKAIFMHKRRREYPITGGASTSAVSIYDEKLKETGLKILRGLNWHGVAMVEFKKNPQGEFVLMEINPKFWGSLDLAIVSGVEFPYLAVKLALGENFDPVLDYKKQVIYRWPFPDDTLRLFAKPSSLGIYLLDCLNPMVKSNIWLSDCRPNWVEFKKTFYTLWSRIKRKELKYPHGRPENI